MRPDDTQPTRRTGVPQSTHRPASHVYSRSQQDAAANIVRGQISSIFAQEEQPSAPAPAQNVQSSPPQAPAHPVAQEAQPSTQPQPPATTSHQESLATASPYERTHNPQASIQPEQWKAYHSAWQDYYKRYYEGYYTQQLSSAKKTIAQNQQPASETPKTAIGSHMSEQIQTKEGPVTRKEAMEELRTKLLDKVETSAKKARKSRHFIPVIATLSVLLIFGFLQYNTVLIANVKAYVTPGNIDPQNIIVDPANTVAVDPEPRLIIPKINVDTPVFYDIPTDQTSQDKAMENGVAHFGIPGANSRPGEIGNTVLSGHSSNDVFAAGDYKFIFMQLDKLEIGDTIYANYEGTRYTYVVTEKKEVAPTDVQALIYDTDKPEMTLITCTPLGTALRRLLVTAEQVYPTTSKPAPTQSDNTPSETSIPGQGQPSVLQRLFS